nr:c-type cytochrome [Saprospiraceae bacterium]
MRTGVFLFILLVVGACQQQENALERPYAHWARRSVLDQRPRMLTLALAEGRYAAYDVEKCGLYKLWQGGVFWDGAAFNNIKTIQPTSWGTSYWEEIPEGRTWQIEWDKSEATIQPQFKGYKIQNNRITLQYTLAWEEENIIITEQPDWRTHNEDSIIFQRIITTQGVPSQAKLYYQGFLLKDMDKTVIEQGFSRIPTPPRPPRQASSNNSQYWLDRSGCNTCHRMEEQTIGPSYQAIANRYGADTEEFVQLVKKVKEGGVGAWGDVPMSPHPQLAEGDIRNMLRYILSLQPKDKAKSKYTQKASPKAPSKKPGFGAPLEAIHPSFDLQNIRPTWFRPRVGAMDFHPDGRLLLTTWDSIGALYAMQGVESGDTNQITIERIATGLSEPLGLKVVGEDVFVLQKQELSQLLDEDKDGIIDEYRTICDAFGVRPDFHEYSYGLVYKDGFFYANLGLAMRLMSHEVQLEDRGTAIKIGLDGQYERIATGLRQTNGIGLGPEDEIFVAENQGQWVPACKIIHLQKGHFYGCQYQTGDRYEGQVE